MLAVLAHPIYGRLFAAQAVALLGTGLLTVALGLLAHDIAGEDAGAVLGTALFLKMAAYVGLSPLAGAIAERLPRRAMLVGLDLFRAGMALALPFVEAVWQVYLLVFLLQAASAGFTPTFQATIPDILPDEADYTRALSLSRLAYDLEALLSPVLAAALLTVLAYHDLFAGTVAGFLLSAALVLSVRLPSPAPGRRRPFAERVTRGVRIYLATPRLRGALALFAAVAAAGAMVIVNTVVIVKTRFGLGDPAVAVALGAYGAGSMAVALALPRLLERLPERGLMTAGALLLGLAMLAGPAADGLAALAPIWLAAGAGASLVQTPMGRLLRRSAHAEDRPAVFAAQFALSHACWLVTYPLAGQLGSAAGLDAAFLALGAVAVAAAVAARILWPGDEPDALAHAHPDLEAGHPHLADPPVDGRRRHTHALVIDDLHPVWPR